MKQAGTSKSAVPVRRNREKQVVAPEDWTSKAPKYHFAMACIVSLIVLIFGLLIIYQGLPADKWAAGAVGAVVGYWLPKK